MSTKYIFVTGGVVSSLGKGITAASLGRLLKSRGLRVSMQKFDPYLNVDPGTMSPYQHGEVFVTEDGAETDLDLGHYERFIDVNLNQHSSVTSGKIYWSVINKERSGQYDGRTVQVIPHVTNEIKERITRVAKNEEIDVVITEIGGTVGDIESQPFLEAIRQIKYDVGRENVMYIHVTLIPYLATAGELKTKPTQHSVKELRSIGIQPDILICRTDVPLNMDIKRKIALFCDLAPSEVIENSNVDSIYVLPLKLEQEGLSELVIKKLGLKCGKLDLSEWIEMTNRIKNLKGEVKVALVGKYVELRDAYLSASEALTHGGIYNDVSVDVKWIHSEDVNDENARELLSDVDGIVVPGGFGHRGIEGKISAIKYARENKIPFFGICLGMQLAAVEFARNVLKFKEAHSMEFDPNTPHPVVELNPDQRDMDHLGGPMRLGVYPCKLREGSKAFEAYKEPLIYERHRHRYEINNKYRDELEKNGMLVSGISPDKRFIEILELKNHPWFIGTQFHPEFKSRPTRPHPLFKEFIAACKENRNKK